MFLFPRSAHKIRVPAKHADGTVRFQRVRVSKSPSRPLAFAVLAVPLTILLLETSEYWLPDEYKKSLQKARARTEEEKNRISSRQEASKSKKSTEGSMVVSAGSESNASGKLHGPQDVSFVIRLPFIRQRHPVPYMETDKEWVEASKLMEDPARLMALKKVIVDETIKGWARDKPTLDSIKRVNASDRVKVEVSLDVVVPLYRPPKFDQHAVVWLPDGPRLAKIPLSNTTASRIIRLWYPEVSFKAFWNASIVFTYASYQMARSGIQNIGSSSISVVTPLSSAASHKTAAVRSPSSKKASTSTEKGLNAAEKTDDQLMAFFLDLAKTLTPESPLAQAKMAFLKTSSALQLRALQHVPEGAVVFQGYVVLVGHRGKVKSTISAIYLPAQDRLILPVIIERTEILPSTARWHQVAPRKQRVQPGHKSAVGESQTPQSTADLQANVDRKAKLMGQSQEVFEKLVSAQNAHMEKQRQELARDVQKLEGEGGNATPEAKRQAASRAHYAKKQGNGKLVEMLDSRSSTDPHLRKLIENIARQKASPAQLKEFGSYIDESNAIILAQDIESKHDTSDEFSLKPKQLSEDGPSRSRAVIEKDVKKVEDLKDMKNLKDIKDVPSGKNDESEKSTSDSIGTTREEERKKE